MPDYDDPFNVQAIYLYWYPRNDSPDNAAEIIKIFFANFMNFNTIIPLSLMVSLEVLKALQASVIEFDDDLKNGKDGKMKVLNLKIQENLGNLKYIFTDKTGTLTRNEMEVSCLSIFCNLYEESYINKEENNNENNNIANNDNDIYNELNAYKKNNGSIKRKNYFSEGFDIEKLRFSLSGEGIPPDNAFSSPCEELPEFKDVVNNLFINIVTNHNVLLEEDEEEFEMRSRSRSVSKYYEKEVDYQNNYINDDNYKENNNRRMNNNEDDINKFNILPDNNINELNKSSIINVELKEQDNCKNINANEQPHSSNSLSQLKSENKNVKSKKKLVKDITYQGSNPDEVTLVSAAKQIGLVFLGRDSETITLSKFGEQVTYKILHKFDFTSARMRSSVILRDAVDNKIKLFIKGADNVILRKLNQYSNESLYSKTKEHLETFAKKGLRTLCYGFRVVSESEYQQWEKEYLEIKQKAIENKALENKVESHISQIEKNLYLLGVTGLNDRLQEEVPECLSAFLEANINVWMLTGDKADTAESIGFSCKIFKPDTEIFKIKTGSIEETNSKLKKVLVDMLNNENEFIQSRNKSFKSKQNALISSSNKFTKSSFFNSNKSNNHHNFISNNKENKNNQNSISKLSHGINNKDELNNLYDDNYEREMIFETIREYFYEENELNMEYSNNEENNNIAYIRHKRNYSFNKNYELKDKENLYRNLINKYIKNYNNNISKFDNKESNNNKAYIQRNNDNLKEIEEVSVSESDESNVNSSITIKKDKFNSNMHVKRIEENNKKISDQNTSNPNYDISHAPNIFLNDSILDDSQHNNSITNNYNIENHDTNHYYSTPKKVKNERTSVKSNTEIHSFNNSHKNIIFDDKNDDLSLFTGLLETTDYIPKGDRIKRKSSFDRDHLFSSMSKSKMKEIKHNKLIDQYLNEKLDIIENSDNNIEPNETSIIKHFIDKDFFHSKVNTVIEKNFSNDDSINKDKLEKNKPSMIFKLNKSNLKLFKKSSSGSQNNENNKKTLKSTNKNNNNVEDYYNNNYNNNKLETDSNLLENNKNILNDNSDHKASNKYIINNMQKINKSSNFEFGLLFNKAKSSHNTNNLKNQLNELNKEDVIEEDSKANSNNGSFTDNLDFKDKYKATNKNNNNSNILNNQIDCINPQDNNLELLKLNNINKTSKTNRKSRQAYTESIRSSNIINNLNKENKVNNENIEDKENNNNNSFDNKLRKSKVSMNNPSRKSSNYNNFKKPSNNSKNETNTINNNKEITANNDKYNFNKLSKNEINEYNNYEQNPSMSKTKNTLGLILSDQTSIPTINSIMKDYEEKIRIINKNKYSILNFNIDEMINKVKHTEDSETKEINSVISIVNFGIILEGSAISYCMEKQNSDLFWKILAKSKSIICARCSPSQKAEVVTFIKEKSKKVTLSIGDGGNDVNMIKCANVGVGIFGKEGYQAAYSSDYAIENFKYLRPLVFKHGRFSILRNSYFTMFFFFKNLMFTLPQFWFCLYNGFSGQQIFDDWFYLGYNSLLSSFPVIVKSFNDEDFDYKFKNFKPQHQSLLK